MNESPIKQKSTSRVIDDLHSKIDILKEELENLKMSHSEYKKRNTNLSNKNDSLIDQLANCKHENDMINALLKRKERRIADLEGQFDDMNSETETLRQSVKNYKIRCDNLSESSAMSTAEFERLKISYDALMASQAEYKRHYQSQVATLSAQFDSYKAESSANLEALAESQKKHEKDQETLIESLTSRNKAMELVYFNKNKRVISALALLAKVAKLHGEESKSLLHDNVEIINAARIQYPKLGEILSERTEATIDLDELLRESDEKLDVPFDMSENFSEEKAGTRPASSRQKRKNRRSMRITSENVDNGESLPLPRARDTKDASRRSPSLEQNNRRANSQRRTSQNSNQSRGSSGTQRNSQVLGQSGGSGGAKQHGSGNGWSTPDAGRKNSGAAKNSKRRSFHGGSSYYNSGNERKASTKSESPA